MDYPLLIRSHPQQSHEEQINMTNKIFGQLHKAKFNSSLGDIYPDFSIHI